MAQRWTFKEDYTVCKFVNEHYLFVQDRELSDLDVELRELGFDRGETAILKRVRDYQKLIIGQDTPYATNQERMVSEYFIEGSRIAELNQWIDRYVEEVYCPNELSEELASLMNDSIDGSERYLPIETVEVKESFYIIFNELLDKYYADHKTGKKTLGSVKKEFRYYLERDYCVSGNTFDAIRRQKYDSVSRRNLFRLCFALELDYVNAKRLLESVGFDFRRSEKEEVVLEAILKCDSHRRFIISEVNETLERNGCERLF